MIRKQFSSATSVGNDSAPSMGRLEKLREQLSKDSNGVEDFVSMEGIQVLDEEYKPKKRRKPFVPKPKWLKADIPSGENYERLKDTVRALPSFPTGKPCTHHPPICTHLLHKQYPR